MGEWYGNYETPPSFSREYAMTNDKSTSGSPYCLLSDHSRNEDMRTMTKGVLGSSYFRLRDLSETEKDIRPRTKGVFGSSYFMSSESV